MNRFNKLALACGLLTVAIPGSMVVAQDSANVLEEITVTGRKVEESLIDVPVSISVWTSSALQDAGIVDAQSLFDATPGLTFDTVNGDRNSANPGIRGVQATEVSTVLQKVNTFVDGTPILGQANSISFNGVDQIEIYRGPQSAAFGRSTFAGALNYITSDATEEFEGTVTGKVSDLGGNEIGVRLSGPINDRVGYRVSYVVDEFTGADEWTATDGTELGTRGTETLSGKLNFEFSDTVYGEVVYNRLDQDDGPPIQFVLDRENCSGGDSGIFLDSMMNLVELPASGSFDCDIDSASVERNADVIGDFLGQYDANRSFYEAQVGNINALDANGDGILQANEYLSQTLIDGSTFEQALIAASPTNNIITERDRIHGSINFEVGDSLLSVLGMYSDEFSRQFIENDINSTTAVFTINMMTGVAALDNAVGTMANPTSIEEAYLEARWASPNQDRFRYTLSGSIYDYQLTTQTFMNFGAIVNNQTTPDGSPVDAVPGFLISNSTTTIGASFGLFYDLSDSTTLTVEGRYQNDENSGENPDEGISASTTSNSFSPRIAINHSISDTANIYAQISQGTNPAGVNIAYADPDVIQAIQIASGQIPVPATDADGVPLDNAGVLYDGTNGNDPAVFFSANSFVDYEEETITNYEFGFKGNWADGRGSFAGALFYADWEDQILAENLNWDDDAGWNLNDWNDDVQERAFFNAGDVELFGFEAEADYRINDIFSVNGNLSLLSSTYADYCSLDALDYEFADGSEVFADIIVNGSDNPAEPNRCGIVTGNDVPRQADFRTTVNLTTNLPNDIFGMRASIRTSVRHIGASFIDDLNLLEQPAATTVNLSATLRNDKFNIRFFVNNLTDDDTPRNINVGGIETNNADPTLASINTPGFLVTPTNPREIGVSVTYDF